MRGARPDPLASITSGALLITAPPEQVAAISAALEQAGIGFSLLGEVVSAGEPAVFMWNSTGRHPLPLPARDEIAKLFDPPQPAIQ